MSGGLGTTAALLRRWRPRTLSLAFERSGSKLWQRLAARQSQRTGVLKPRVVPSSRGGPNRADRTSFFLGALCVLALTLALLTGIIRGFAGSGALFTREMRRFAQPERTGLPETEYSAMGQHIADYLIGQKDDFQFILTGPSGERLLCFHEEELMHMADCQGLIRLDTTVCAVSLAVFLLAAGWLLVLNRKACGRQEGDSRPEADMHGIAPSALKGARTALRALGILSAVLLPWALINFDGLFVTFHKIAFRNDLWLLNPRTDLLIRLMPLNLFIDLGIKGLAVFAAGMAVITVAVLSMYKFSRQDLT